LLVFFPILFAVGTGEDPGLIDALRRREPEALGRLYDRYGKLVYSLIYRIVRNESVAEDLVQETFLRVWNRAQGFQSDRGAVGPWLLAIARNRAIDYLRSVDGRMAKGALELDALEHPVLFVNIEDDLLNTDRLRRIRSAFEKLNDNHRMVLELAYFEGLSQSEMAERTQVPLGTIKTWVRAALQTLRDEMGEAVPA